MSDYREMLAAQVREALGGHNDDKKPVVVLVRDLRAALDQERADCAKLRAFAQACEAVRLESEGMDELMEQHGLLVRQERDAPCGKDCYCRDEYGKDIFPTDCLKPTALLSGRGPKESPH